jgi:hypothetical protein
VGIFRSNFIAERHKHNQVADEDCEESPPPPSSGTFIGGVKRLNAEVGEREYFKTNTKCTQASSHNGMF